MALALRRSRYRIDVVGSTTESQEVLEVVMEKEPNVAVIGSNLHDGSLAGFRVLRELLACRSTEDKIRVRDKELPFLVDAVVESTPSQNLNTKGAGF